MIAASRTWNFECKQQTWVDTVRACCCYATRDACCAAAIQQQSVLDFLNVMRFAGSYLSLDLFIKMSESSYGRGRDSVDEFSIYEVRFSTVCSVALYCDLDLVVQPLWQIGCQICDIPCK